MRSSATWEDSAQSSFAGLHESYVNVPAERLVEHVVRVWASLWSNRALLYRRDLDLSVSDSAMAVVVQELIDGRSSGVAFGRDPTRGDAMVVEAVRGLCAGLVDGRVEPDRWQLGRSTGAILTQRLARAKQRLVRDASLGTRLEPVPAELQTEPVLSAEQLRRLHALLLRLEEAREGPQDVEWTYAGEDELVLLQARPITTAPTQQDDERAWYLTPQDSLPRLSELRRRIDEVHLPAMEEEAATIALSTDDDVTVDGHLGIVIRHGPAGGGAAPS